MKKIVFPLVLLFSVWLSAQNVKFGKVEKAEISESAYPTDADAPAAILYRSTNIRYDYRPNSGFWLVTEVFERRKIYNKAGLDNGNFEVYLYKTRSNQEKIQSVKGITYNLSGDKIEEIKLKKDQVFQTNYNKYFDVVKITPPNIKEGSVVDISYEIHSQINYIHELIFQESIPVKKAEAQVRFLEYYQFKPHVKGMFPLTFDQKFDVKTIKLMASATSDGGIDSSIQTNSSYNGTVSVKENVYTISGQNIPAIKPEAYVNNIKNYWTTVRYELTSIKLPDEPFKMYAQTWGDVAKTLNEDADFGQQLGKSSYFKKDLQALQQQYPDSLQQLVAIYSFVKQKMNWDKNYAVSCDDGVEKAYERGSGNVAEINLILTAMLREAGFPADPVAVSTRLHGIPVFPTLDGFNYILTRVKTASGNLLLDATEKYGMPGIIPERVINWVGYAIKKDGSAEQIKLIPTTPSKTVVYVTAQLHPDGSAQGKVRLQHFDQFAFNFRQYISDLKQELILENIENNYFNSDIEIDDYKMLNKDDLSKPIIENFSFKKEDQCEIIGEKIYVSPLLFTGRIENPFKLDIRDYPIDFGFPYQYQYLITINIPEGYQLESVPESVAFEMPEKIGSYQLNITSRANQVQIKLTSNINAPLISPEGYEMIKNYFSQIVEKNKDRIVIVKKTQP